jgi:hypothetical protein
VDAFVTSTKDLEDGFNFVVKYTRAGSAGQIVGVVATKFVAEEYGKCGYFSRRCQFESI